VRVLPGVITAVTGFGIFVELSDIYVEGLVHVTSLPGDYYHFDPVHHRLSGERSGRSFRLGDTVEVKVMRVDLDERKIDFELSDSQPAASTARKQRGAVTEGKAGRAGKNASKPAASADVQKSRELKKSLLAGAKGAEKSSGKDARAGRKPAVSRKKSSTASAVAPTPGKPRKRKAKS
jgi:ribonuclease R